MYGIAWVWWYFGQQLWFVCLMRAWCVAGEDLKEVVSGQWVAWKQLGDNAAAGGPLFVKDAFYNFMCPQRPQTV